jgi:hypothetical protein
MAHLFKSLAAAFMFCALPLLSGADAAHPWTTLKSFQADSSQISPDLRTEATCAFDVSCVAEPSGKSFLKLDRSKKSGIGSVNFNLGTPPLSTLKTPFSLKIFLRTEGFADGDVMIRVLQSFPNAAPEYLLFNESARDWHFLKASPAWSQVRLTGDLAPNATSLSLYVSLRNSNVKDAAIFIASINVELLLEKDRLCVVSSEFGNVFAAEQGALSLRIPNLSRLSHGSIEILDEQMRPVGGKSFGDGQDSIPFEIPKGYASIRGEAVYKDGSVARCVASAAAVGILLPESVPHWLSRRGRRWRRPWLCAWPQSWLRLVQGFCSHKSHRGEGWGFQYS